MSRLRTARAARALWIAWAVIVWNVVFDRVIVVAGRDYINAARNAVLGGAAPPRMDDFMRPAVSHGVWLSSICAVAIVAVGLPAIAYGVRHHLTPEARNRCQMVSDTEEAGG
jgi:hypothetical protein